MHENLYIFGFLTLFPELDPAVSEIIDWAAPERTSLIIIRKCALICLWHNA